MKALLKRWLSQKIVWGATLVVALAALAASQIRNTISSVKLQSVKKGDLTSAVYGSAQLKTDQSFDLKLGTVARITSILKSVGQRVFRGETIVLFDNLPAFRAPIEGTITAINFRSGETAFAQSTVLSIVDPRNFYLEMSLDQKSVRYVRAGQAARLSFEGYRDLKFEGTVRSTFSNSSVFYAIIDLKASDPSFLPGMSADVAIITEKKRDVLLAPVGALKDGKLMVKRSGPPEEIAVVVGGNDGVLAEVVSTEIKPGDLAVIRSTLPFRQGGGVK